MYRAALFLTLTSMASALINSTITSSSLTYLVDTTGSMAEEIYQLKMVNNWVLDRVTAKFPSGVRQYTMVEFNDPYVGPVRFTHSKQQFGDFFNSLVVNGGGDCPELAMRGLELALMNSPSNSIILVLTDASALDYANTTLVNNIRSLINTTKSKVIFAITGVCNTTDSPDFLIYRDIATLSFGHVYIIGVSELYKVFNYLDYTLSMPANSSNQLFSGDFTALYHNESFTVSKNFSSIMITTDGLIYNVTVNGPSLFTMDKPVLELWGYVLMVKKPPNGNWSVVVYAGGLHSIRVEGFTPFNTTSNCSKCHVNATCEDYFGSLQCLCKDCFIGDGFNCTDVDECAYNWTNSCSGGMCNNKIGSYSCTCPSGYYNASPTSCVDINECSNSTLNKCHSLATCVNSVGNYTCVCPYGYFGNGHNCEVNDCTRAVCSLGMDCVKTTGSYLCVDPCSTYTTLNDPWRSTLNYVSSAYAGSYSFTCDNDKAGWYRFVGSGGTRIPETCMPPLSCGTHAPMWMYGVHPTMSDGVVNRTACASWSGNCCYWSSAIRVKACPSGYYVYQLSGTPACTLAYCTYAATVNASCEADEDWNLIGKEYGCTCKSQYKVSALSDVRPELTCGINEMKASFHKCQARALNFNMSKDNFKNNSCFQFQEDKFTNTFSVLSRLQAGNCGVQSSQNLTHVTYTSNLLVTSETPGIITRSDNLTVIVSCTYPLDLMISLSQVVKPISKSTVINVGGTGQFAVTMALFNDSSYLVPYVGSQVSLSFKDTLYIGAYIQGGDNSTYVLVMKNCYATPFSNPNDTLKYYIIKDSCPNKQDSSISVSQNGVSREGRLSVQMFQFVGNNYDSVYLHCELGLCNAVSGSCTPSCSGARSAGLDMATQDLTIGPIKRAETSNVVTSACASPILRLSTLLLMIISSVFL
ncbi:uromodulin-like [Anomaloglossus baeobatrachus]|uniref:uromodulin-like n=1 Tax=Anomaloglossus baeobatrachus TaxID=238106 RepID=UPI003F4F7430